MTFQQRAPMSTPLACSLVPKHKMPRRRPPTSTAFFYSALALVTLGPLLCGAGQDGGGDDKSALVASPGKDACGRASSLPQRRVPLGAELRESRSTSSADASSAGRHPPARGTRQERGTRPRRPAPLPADGDTREDQPAAPAETPSIDARPPRHSPSAAWPRHRPATESSSFEAVARVPVGQLSALGPPFHVVKGGPGECIYANLPSEVFLRYVQSLSCQPPLEQHIERPSPKPFLHQREQSSASHSECPQPGTSRIRHGDVQRLPDTQRSRGPEWSQPARLRGGRGLGRAATRTRVNTSASKEGCDESSGAEGQQGAGRPGAIRHRDQKTEGPRDQRPFGAGSAEGQAAGQRSGPLRCGDPLHTQSQHETLEASSRPPAAAALPSETWPTRASERGGTSPLTCEKFTQTKSKFFRIQRTRADDSSAFHEAPRGTAEADNRWATRTRDNTSASKEGCDESSGAEKQRDGRRPGAIRHRDERTDGQRDQRPLGAGSAEGQAAEQRSGALRGSDPLHTQSHRETLEANSRPPAAGALPSETWPTRASERGGILLLTCEKFTQTKSKFFRVQRARADDSLAFYEAPRATAEAGNRSATRTRDNTIASKKGCDESSDAEEQQDGGRPCAIRHRDGRTDGLRDQRPLGAGSAKGQAAEQRSGALRGSVYLHTQSHHETLEEDSRSPAAGALLSGTWPTRASRRGSTPPLTSEKFTQTKSKFFRVQRARADDSSAFHGAPRATAEASNWSAMMPASPTRCVPLQTAEAAYLPSGYRLHSWPLGRPPECVRVAVHERSAFDQQSAPVIRPITMPSTRHQSAIVLGAEGTWAAASFLSNKLGDPGCLPPSQDARAGDEYSAADQFPVPTPFAQQQSAVVRGAECGGGSASYSLREHSDHGHPPFLSPLASFPLHGHSLQGHLVSLPPLETGEDWVPQGASSGRSAVPLEGTYQALQSMKIADLYPCDPPYGYSAATATTVAVQGAPQPAPPMMQPVASGGEPAPSPPAFSSEYWVVPIAQPPISGCCSVVPPQDPPLASPSHPSAYHPTHDPQYFPYYGPVPGFPHVSHPGHAQPAALEPADAGSCPLCSRRLPLAPDVASSERPQFASPEEEVALQQPPS